MFQSSALVALITLSMTSFYCQAAESKGLFRKLTAEEVEQNERLLQVFPDVDQNWKNRKKKVDAKRLVKFYRAKGRLFHNGNPNVYAFMWPEPYKAQREAVRRQEWLEEDERIRRSKRGALRKFLGKKEVSTSQTIKQKQPYETESDEETVEELMEKIRLQGNPNEAEEDQSSEPEEY